MKKIPLAEKFERCCHWKSYEATYDEKYQNYDIQAGLFALRLNGEFANFGTFQNGLKSRIRVLRKKEDNDKEPYRIINEKIKQAIISGKSIEAFVLPLPNSTPQERADKLREIKDGPRFSGSVN